MSRIGLLSVSLFVVAAAAAAVAVGKPLPIQRILSGLGHDDGPGRRRAFRARRIGTFLSFSGRRGGMDRVGICRLRSRASRSTEMAPTSLRSASASTASDWSSCSTARTSPES